MQQNFLLKLFPEPVVTFIFHFIGGSEGRMLWVVCQEMRSGDTRASDVARGCMTLVSPHLDVDLARHRDVTNGLMPPCPILLSESHSCLAVVWSVERHKIDAGLSLAIGH